MSKMPSTNGANKMTVGEHLAQAAAWEARQRQMTPIAVVALVFAILGAAVTWLWFLGAILAVPYCVAWVNRARALAEVNHIFSR